MTMTRSFTLTQEIPDGKDNDCDGGVDEKTTLTDDDGDSLF